MHEVALHRLTLGIKHDGDGLRSHVLSRLLCVDQVQPTRAAKYIGPEGELVFEIVFLHDPGRTQAASVEIILKIVLLQHDLF